MSSKPKSRLITAGQLRAKGACKSQIDLFVEQTGGSLDLTVAWAEKHAQHYDWDWWGINLLSASAWEAYEAARARALEAYKAAIARASEAYEVAIARAFARAYINDGGTNEQD